MPGFIRRFGFFPADNVITAIEGVVIVDTPPPGTISGSETGVTAVVGEFADMTYAVSVNGSGAVSTDIRPQEVFSAQDLDDKFAGFDPTLGDFGVSGGNGFVALRNKRFARLIVAPVNLASPTGTRYFRDLPVCTSATDPLPVVPVEGATVKAGTEFRSPTNGRIKVAKTFTFTALPVIHSGTGGATTNAGSAAATQNFTVTGQDFSAVARPDGGVGVKEGDIVVFGQNSSGAIAPAASGGDLGGGTYRVAADAVSGSPTVLSLETLNGDTFDFVTSSANAWRIHVGSDADSAPVIVLGQSEAGGYAAADVGGYSIPVRPLTDEDGVGSDGTWTAGLDITPLSSAAAATGSTWEPLSGLLGRIIPTGGVAFDASVQGPNAVSSSDIDALYTTALDALVSAQAPLTDINIVYSARTSATIRTGLRTHVLTASARNSGRMAIIRPELTTTALATVVGSSSPGVGAVRNERVIYAWPGARVFVPEAVGFRLKTADTLTTDDGILDVGLDGFVASVLSNLPPERNPGQAAEPVPTVMSPILAVQRAAPDLDLPEYVTLRSRGVCALRNSPRVGFILQSGITTSLTSGQTNINRRRMADFIQDSVSARLISYSKLPLTNSNKDSAVGEVDTFLAGLLSVDNPAAQRINAYEVDDKSGNTPAREAQGIFVIIARVRLTPTGDFLVFQTEISENTVITNAA